MGYISCILETNNKLKFCLMVAIVSVKNSEEMWFISNLYETNALRRWEVSYHMNYVYVLLDFETIAVSH